MDLACAVRHGHRPPLLAEPKTTAHVPGSESARPCPALAGTDALAPMTWAQQGQGTVVPTPRLSHRKRSSLLLGLVRPPGTLPVPTPQSAGPGLVPHLPPSMCPGAHVCVHTHMHTHPAHMHACHTCTRVHACATPAHTYHKLHACTYTLHVCVHAAHARVTWTTRVHSCTCMHHICVHLPQTTCVRAHIHHTHVRVPHVHATRVPAPCTPHTQRPASSPAAPSLPRHERPCGWHASAPRGHLLGAPLHPTLSADKRPALRPQV